jgi:hypothetical protein
MAWPAEHSRVSGMFLRVILGDSRIFWKDLKQSRNFESVTKSSRTFWKFLHGSTSIHALYKSLSKHFRVSSVKTAIEWRLQSDIVVNCAMNKVSFSAHTGGVVQWLHNPTRNTLFDVCWYNVHNCLLIKTTLNKSIWLLDFQFMNALL